MTSFNRDKYHETVVQNLIAELDSRGLKISDEAVSGFFDILKDSLYAALDSTFLELMQEPSKDEILETVDK